MPVANAAPVPAITLAGEIYIDNGSSDVAAATGVNLTFDAGGTKDPEGDAITFSWSLTAKPAGSTAAIAGNTGAQPNFKPDVDGTYVANLHVTDSKGAAADKSVTIVAHTRALVGVASHVVVVAPVTAGSGTNSVVAPTGYFVALSSGGNGKDAAGNTLNNAWSVVSKPAGSTALLSSANGIFTQLVPDVLGDYVVQLTTTTMSGVATNYQTTVSVKNRSPQVDLRSDLVSDILAAKQTAHVPLNTTLHLTSYATDADNDALTYNWTLESKPAGSNTTLSNVGTAAQLTTDVAGSYRVRLRVTDAAGAYAEAVGRIESANAPPVLQIDQPITTANPVVSVLVGKSTTVSASSTPDLPITFAFVSRPAGSTAKLNNLTNGVASFVPDIAGPYVVSATVSNGNGSSMTYVNIRAVGSVTSQVALPFTPAATRYSQGLDRFVAVGTDPNALYIVDPYTGTIQSVPLPARAKTFNLSPDGTLAAVLEEGQVSLVDLRSATLLRTSATGGSQSDVFVTNPGLVYLVGQTSGQWIGQAVSVVDGRTGTDLTTILGPGHSTGHFSGAMHGVFSGRNNAALLVLDDPGPNSVSYFTLDPDTGTVTQAGDIADIRWSTIKEPFFSCHDGEIITSDSYIHSTDFSTYLTQLERLPAFGFAVSVSCANKISEKSVLLGEQGASYSAPLTYKSYYYRIISGLILDRNIITVALPSIDGLQSYGVSLFHSNGDQSVVLVQTGSATANAAGLKYYLLTQ